MSVSPPAPAELDKEKVRLMRSVNAQMYLAHFRDALKARHHELLTGKYTMYEPSLNSDAAQFWFWKIAREIWRPEEFYVHAWAIQMVAKLCELNSVIAVFGAKQTSKSTTMAAFCVILYWAFDGKASVIYRTTTLEEAMQRGWGEIQRLHAAALANTLFKTHYLRSQPPKIVAYQGTEDLKRCIIMKPAQSKAKTSTGSEFGNIKGFHADVQLIIDDELNELPDNASKAPIALFAEYKLFWYVGIGNPTSWDDVLGRLATPKELEINEIAELDLDEWKIEGGTAIRFAAYRSPNIERGQNPDGTWPYTHLPTPGTYQRLIDQSGGSEDHPDVWQFGKGLPHPQGNSFTLLSRVLVKNTRADQPAYFAEPHKVQHGAALDPAFTAGGDDCVLQFFRWGDLVNGGWAFEFGERLHIKLALGSEDEIFFFVAEQAKQACENRGVPPNHFSYDCTGTGLGLRSILTRVWPGVNHYLEYSGKPTDRRLSVDDNRKACDVFDKRACEISFKLRLFIEYGQVRGLNDQNDLIIKEGTERRWRRKGKKREVESKDEVYSRNRSCDHWDAAAVAADLMCQLGYLPGGQAINQQSQVVAPRPSNNEFGNVAAAFNANRGKPRPNYKGWLQGDGFDTSGVESA